MLTVIVGYITPCIVKVFIIVTKKQPPCVGHLCLLSPQSERNSAKWIVEILFSFDVCLCVCAQPTGQSDKFKTAKATDFKFDMRVSRDSPDMTLKNFSKGA